MNATDMAALLTMMEGGRLVRAKRGRELDIHNPLKVIAASNRLEKLSPELRSRFAIRRLNPYSREEFLIVVKGVLVRKENLSEELAEKIAMDTGRKKPGCQRCYPGGPAGAADRSRAGDKFTSGKRYV